jgi:hypothetical protein
LDSSKNDTGALMLFLGLVASRDITMKFWEICFASYENGLKNVALSFVV